LRTDIVYAVYRFLMAGFFEVLQMEYFF
jgi:hypothetical protein